MLPIKRIWRQYRGNEKSEIKEGQIIQEKDKKTNSGIRNITQKTQGRATPATVVKAGASGRASSSYSTCDTHSIRTLTSSDMGIVLYTRMTFSDTHKWTNTCYTWTVLWIKKCQSETDDEYEKKVYAVVINYYPTNNDNMSKHLSSEITEHKKTTTCWHYMVLYIKELTWGGHNQVALLNSKSYITLNWAFHFREWNVYTIIVSIFI